MLVSAINYQAYEMPPTGKLSPQDIATLTEWVRRGLPMPAQLEVAEAGHHPPEVNAETRAFWSFQPVHRPDLPQGAGDGLHPIDAFVQSRLTAEGLAPNPPADPRARLPRLHYDLLGLPPESEQVEQFVAAYTADSEGTWTRTVDELLASPRYGEHWGRHWLDLVRYAETNSYERDDPKPFVWRYRDYVIRSFNDDKPYDQFIREQLAGDELDAVTPETLIATGYYRLGLWDDEPADRGTGALRRARRHRGHDVAGVSRADDGLCPLPRSQDRSDPAARLLPAAGLLPQRAALRRCGDESVTTASVRIICAAARTSRRRRRSSERAGEAATTKNIWTRWRSAIRPQLTGGEKDDFKQDQSALRRHREPRRRAADAGEFDAYSRAADE